MFTSSGRGIFMTSLSNLGNTEAVRGSRFDKDMLCMYTCVPPYSIRPHLTCYSSRLFHM